MSAKATTSLSAAVEELDVLIVGAGISGIDARLSPAEALPGQEPTPILEARERIGGTWDLFRYPGIRSDSDMYTLGFPFRPWTGAQVDRRRRRRSCDYVEETRARVRDRRQIRFGHARRARGRGRRPRRAGRSRPSARRRRGRHAAPASSFLCSGYYDYDEGYRPEWPGDERYRGRIVHPQHWPRGPRLRRQADRRDRQRRDRGDAGARRWPRRPRT